MIRMFENITNLEESLSEGLREEKVRILIATTLCLYSSRFFRKTREIGNPLYSETTNRPKAECSFNRWYLQIDLVIMTR
jgi:hypothetical protein